MPGSGGESMRSSCTERSERSDGFGTDGGQLTAYTIGPLARGARGLSLRLQAGRVRWVGWGRSRRVDLAGVTCRADLSHPATSAIDPMTMRRIALAVQGPSPQPTRDPT